MRRCGRLHPGVWRCECERVQIDLSHPSWSPRAEALLVLSSVDAQSVWRGGRDAAGDVSEGHRTKARITCTERLRSASFAHVTVPAKPGHQARRSSTRQPHG